MKGNTSLVLFLGVLLLSYSTYRAVTVSMTIDESSTWHNYVFKSIDEIITNTPPSGNNHILNTLLIKLSVSIFGSHPFTVRLPNVLGHLIYLVFSFLFLKTVFKRPTYLLFGFACLNFNPYMLDFFSIGRGYGISMAGIMGSLYFVSLYIKGHKEKDLVGSIICAILSTYANFVSLNYFVALIGVLFLLIFFNGYEKDPQFPDLAKYIFQKSRFIYLGVLLLGILIFIPVGKLHMSGELRVPGFWGDNGFWQDTVKSLVANSTYVKRHLDMGKYTYPILEGMTMIIFIVSPLFSLFQIRSGRSEYPNRLLLSLWGILFLAGSSTIVQNWIFGTKFLNDRTALMFIPLFASVFCLFIFTLINRIDKLSSILPILMGLFILLHLSKSVNFYHFHSWMFEANTDEMVSYVNKKALEKGEKLKLGVHWRHMPATNFYIRTRYDSHIEWVDWEAEIRKDDLYDYYFIPQKDAHLINEYYTFEKDFFFSQLFKKKSIHD